MVKFYIKVKLINNYIEGLDLLEGKYNLANDNLPYQEVSQVQILENHQPIKHWIVYSFLIERLNIKLKTPILLQVKLGGSGFSPLLWDANITDAFL
jgi:hypothetical protein